MAGDKAVTSCSTHKIDKQETDTNFKNYVKNQGENISRVASPLRVFRQNVWEQQERLHPGAAHRLGESFKGQKVTFSCTHTELKVHIQALDGNGRRRERDFGDYKYKEN